jgi:hypothetical protein
MRKDDIRQFCRVCGIKYDHDHWPWGDDNKTGSFEICICCGVTFGYQDTLPSSARKFRENWISGGMIWRRIELRPANWGWQSQFDNIPNDFK